MVDRDVQTIPETDPTLPIQNLLAELLRKYGYNNQTE